MFTLKVNYRLGCFFFKFKEIIKFWRKPIFRGHIHFLPKFVFFFVVCWKFKKEEDLFVFI